MTLLEAIDQRLDFVLDDVLYTFEKNVYYFGSHTTSPQRLKALLYEKKHRRLDVITKPPVKTTRWWEVWRWITRQPEKEVQ